MNEGHSAIAEPPIVESSAPKKRKRKKPSSATPRGCRMVALGTPSDREKTEWCFQRYVTHLPAAREIVCFDRSWYNRAGVEHVIFPTDVVRVVVTLSLSTTFLGVNHHDPRIARSSHLSSY